MFSLNWPSGNSITVITTLNDFSVTLIINMYPFKSICLLVYKSIVIYNFQKVKTVNLVQVQKKMSQEHFISQQFYSSQELMSKLARCKD